MPPVGPGHLGYVGDAQVLGVTHVCWARHTTILVLVWTPSGGRVVLGQQQWQ